MTIKWRFFYYHRSGFIKDCHDAWLTYSSDRRNLQGRGIDNIGPYLLKGITDIGLSGVSWYLNKYYLQNELFENSFLNYIDIDENDIDQNQNENDLKLAWIQNLNNEWYSDEYYYNVGKKSVIHLGYISVDQNLIENENKPLL